jgi:hypothetical protein
MPCWLAYGVGLASGLLLGRLLRVRRDRLARRWSGMF